MDGINPYPDPAVIDARHRTLIQMLEAGPEHFCMDDWIYAPSEPDVVAGVLTGSIDLTPCGTTACIAGHAFIALYSGATNTGTRTSQFIDWPHRVAERLGVDHDAFLFVSRWPEPMATARASLLDAAPVHRRSQPEVQRFIEWQVAIGTLASTLTDPTGGALTTADRILAHSRSLLAAPDPVDYARRLGAPATV